MRIICRCFTGTHSRIKGAGFAAIFQDLATQHAVAYPRHTDLLPQLRNPGQFHLRNGGEAHLNTPEGMVALQQVHLLQFTNPDFSIMFVDLLNRLLERIPLKRFGNTQDTWTT